MRMQDEWPARISALEQPEYLTSDSSTRVRRPRRPLDVLIVRIHPND